MLPEKEHASKELNLAIPLIIISLLVGLGGTMDLVFQTDNIKGIPNENRRALDYGLMTMGGGLFLATLAVDGICALREQKNSENDKNHSA